MKVKKKFIEQRIRGFIIKSLISKVNEITDERNFYKEKVEQLLSSKGL